MLPDFEKLDNSSFSNVHKTPTLPAYQPPPLLYLQLERKTADGGVGSRQQGEAY